GDRQVTLEAVEAVSEHRQGNFYRTGQCAGSGLRGSAHVEELQVRFQAAKLSKLANGQPRAGPHQIGTAGEQGGGVGELAGHPVQADPAETELGLRSEGGNGDPDDV